MTDLVDDTDTANGTCNLREALTASNTSAAVDACPAGSSGNNIYFTKTGRIELIQGLPNISKAVNIVGPGADLLTIDANGFSRVLSFQEGSGLPAQDHTVCGVTLTGGMDIIGGGIFGSFNDGMITVRDAVITENEAGNGAGLKVQNLTLIRVTVSDNTATNSSGGGIHQSSGTLTIFESTITGNTAESQGGGLSMSGVIATIRRSTFSDNTAKGSGGGISFTSGSAASTLDMAYTTITDNTAGANLTSGAGGGLYVTSSPDNSSTLILINTIIAGNADVSPSFVQPDISLSAVWNIIQTQGYNLIGDRTGDTFNGFPVGNPNANDDYVGTAASPLVANLLPLAPVSSPTATHRPDVGAAVNTVIDTGSCGVEDYDQRGKSGNTTALFRVRDLAAYANADDGCDIGAHEEQAFAKPLSFDIKVLLDGPYTNVLMNTALNQAGQVPLAHPYNTAPWNYTGFSQVTSISPDMVDWILFELYRGGPEDPGGMTLAYQEAFPLENNGTMETSDVAFGAIHVPPGKYYVVIRHRNHLAVMSAKPVSLAWDGQVTYDFRTDLESAYSAGGAAMRDVGGGFFTMWGGDGNADQSVSAFDFLLAWLPINGQENLYEGGDFNMDGSGTAFDFLLVWLPANGIESQATN